MSQALTELNDTTALTPTLPPGARSPTPATIPVPGRDEGEVAAARDQEETIDARALREAIAAAEAEEAAAAAAGATPTPETLPTQPNPATGGATAQPQPHVVPVAVVQQLRQAAREKDHQIAYLQGQLDAARAAPTPQPASPGPARAAPTITAEERRAAAVAKIQEAERQMLELAKKYDDGQIASMVEFLTAYQPLQHEVLTAQFADMAGWLADRIPAPQTPVIGLADEKVLSDQVAELEAKYPWSKVMDDKDFQILEDMAMRWFQLRGINLGAGPRKLFLIRERVAKLAQIHGPELHPELVGQVPTPTGTPGTGQNSTSVVPHQTGTAPPASNQPNPLRVAQAAGKMALAAAHPPAIPGAPATSVGGITEEQIERMSPMELEAAVAAMPQATRERFLYGR